MDGLTHLSLFPGIAKAMAEQFAGQNDLFEDMEDL